MIKKLSIILAIFVLFFVASCQAYAQKTLTIPLKNSIQTPIKLRIAADPVPGLGVGTGDAQDGDFVPNAEVTFVGKTASRSGDFLDWTIRNYDWACVTKNADTSCSNSHNPLASFWTLIRDIVYAMLVLVVLAAAFVMIITRGRSLTITRFIPRFMLIIVLVTLSYAIIQFIFQVNDIIQGFFLRVDNKLISTHDLIFIGFDYKTFLGLRRQGVIYDESAFMTLLLVRLTAITYYVMTGVLLIRKIILWFFIILSPVFPLLLFFRPIRNTGKIWIGEFFRWLLYAPLFSIFLHGLVLLWRSGTPDKPGIPLAFDVLSPGHVPGAESDIVYPTAVNILIGGPGQKIGFFNSVNLQDTFALYVVSLLMLWVVIILPFILLKIFLDYVGSISFQDNVFLKRILNKGGQLMPVLNPPPSGSPPGVPPTPIRGAGRAMQLPFSKGKTISEGNLLYQVAGSSQSVSSYSQTNISNQSTISNPENTRILQLANLSIPKMRDIARFETSMLSKDTSKSQEVHRLKTSLSRISNPNIVVTPAERERYSDVRHQLVTEKQKGNVLASSILTASSLMSSQSSLQTTQNTQNLTSILEKIAHPETISIVSERQKYSEMKSELNELSQNGDSLASSVLSTASALSEKSISTEQKTVLSEKLKAQLKKEENNSIANKLQSVGEAGSLTQVHATLPVANKVQQVSIEDYEEVRKMWIDTYKNSAPPRELSGKIPTREEWIKSDIDKINQAITLLNSVDSMRNNEGMEMVSNILPFLMIGGFSRTEVIAYLKAKLEAGKAVLSGDIQKEDEDTFVDRTTSQTTAGRHLQAAAEGTPFVSEDTDVSLEQSSTTESSVFTPEDARILQLANLSIPKMRDIARFEKAILSKDTTQTHDVLTSLIRISDPSIVVVPTERDKYTEVREKLVSEKEKGSILASSILSAAETISASARPQAVSGQKSVIPSTLPVVNHVQQVRIEDYEEVRKMWIDTYQNAAPPQDLSGKVLSREEWLKVDIDKINQAVTLLNSEDTEKSKEGMEIVSNILPFLLIGGFSRNEVISYLNAKLEAGKSVLSGDTKKEENETLLETRSDHSSVPVPGKHLEAAVNGAPLAVNYGNPAQSNAFTSGNERILQLANLSIPKMRDIARYETSILSKDTAVIHDALKLKTSLNRISDPNIVVTPAEREKYTQLREQLVSEKEKGNVLASSILSAANTSSLGTKPHTALGKSLTTVVTNIPVVNHVQQVSIEDYEEVRKMWIDTYQNAVPPQDLSGKALSREEWLRSDIDKINQAIILLSSDDPAKNREGMEIVSNILPFLLIGGFSKNEIIAYLKAKLEAAKAVLSEIIKYADDDTLSRVQVTHDSSEKHLEVAQDEKKKQTQKKTLKQKVLEQ